MISVVSILLDPESYLPFFQNFILFSNLLCKFYIKIYGDRRLKIRFLIIFHRNLQISKFSFQSNKDHESRENSKFPNLRKIGTSGVSHSCPMTKVLESLNIRTLGSNKYQSLLKLLN